MKMQNLISNAVKFMGDQTAPLIEIGTTGLDRAGKQTVFSFGIMASV